MKLQKSIFEFKEYFPSITGSTSTVSVTLEIDYEDKSYKINVESYDGFIKATNKSSSDLAEAKIKAIAAAADFASKELGFKKTDPEKK